MKYDQDPKYSNTIQVNDLKCRRLTPGRRIGGERRLDRHAEKKNHKRSLKIWFRSISNQRSGVDRRKNNDRRKQINNRLKDANPSLTRQEIAYLMEIVD